jgi:TM2 domain-containing membrane protein YozV
MAKIVSLDNNQVQIELENKNSINVDRNSLNFIPQIGDDVSVYKGVNRTVVMKNIIAQPTANTPTASTQANFQQVNVQQAGFQNSGVQNPSMQNPSMQAQNFQSNTNYQQFGNKVTNQLANSKITAGLLSIFLGWLGISNFYLGRYLKAIIQLALMIISCGILFFPLLIWGIIEGILILSSQKGNYWHQDSSGRELSD